MTQQTNHLKGLYVITPLLSAWTAPHTGPAVVADPQQRRQAWLDAVNAAVEGGARILQFRDKSPDAALRYELALSLRDICANFNIPLIINDDVDLARRIEAAGVHIGQDDAGIATARAILGENAIIGVSCYNQPELAVAAQAAGADYVAFGRFFPSRTKPGAVQASLDMLREARPKLHIPVVAIGGITLQNAAGLIQAGADAVAVIDGVLAQPDPGMAAKRIQALFDS